MKLSVHTLRYGNPDWMQKCAPTLEAWCHRHGYPLRVWGDEFPQYPCPKFGEIEMLREFLQGDADMCFYIDADVIVHKDAPLPDFPAGMSMSTDSLHRVHDEQWRTWCEDNFGVRPDDTYDYSNAGVWLIDRPAAEAMLEHFKPPFVEYFQDQHQWNLAAYLAMKAGMPFNRLPQEWNHSNRLGRFPAWFTHIWGDNKEEEIAAL